MTGTLILFPEAEDAALFIEDGAVAARGADALARSGEEDVRRVLIAPANLTALHWMEATALTPAQARAAARVELGDQVLFPADDLHIAVGEQTPEDGQPRAVAFASSSALRNLVAEHRPDSVIPAALILPATDLAFTRAKIGSDDIVRGADAAFVHDEALTPLLTGGTAITDIGAEEIETRLIEAAANPPLDLRQGPLAPPRTWSFDKGLLGQAGRLLAILALISLAIPLVEMFRLSWNSSTITEAATTRAQAALGDPAPPADPVAALDARLSTFRGGGAGFGATMTAVAQAVKATPNAELMSATFRSDGVLALTARTAIPDEIRVLQEKLAANGLSVTAKPVNPSLNPPTVDLEVRGQ